MPIRRKRSKYKIGFILNTWQTNKHTRNFLKSSLICFVKEVYTFLNFNLWPDPYLGRRMRLHLALQFGPISFLDLLTLEPHHNLGRHARLSGHRPACLWRFDALDPQVARGAGFARQVAGYDRVGAHVFGIHAVDVEARGVAGGGDLQGDMW